MARAWWWRDVVAAVLAAAILTAATPVLADDEETLQRATDEAIQKIGADLGRTKFPKIKSVAVVPLRGDANEYATTSLRSAVTKTPYGLFTREDDTWNTLLAEIEWGVSREDIMAPKTVQKFGKIEGVDAILYGFLWDRDVNLWSVRGHAKMSVQLADVETGQVLWSSGPVEGEAFIHWSDAVTRFWRYPLVLIGAVVGLLIVLVVLRGIGRAVRHATRPL